MKRRTEPVNALEVVRQEIERRRLIEPGMSIVVGVSGGADSLCLLHVLDQLQTEYKYSLHIAHLNHCLRGKDADEDMLFVTQLALDWGLPCTIGVVDVKTLALQRRLSLEETARQVRYGFLADTARQVGATVVAVGHNADDQSETVLMHFLRGTGLAGLRGMLPSVDLESLRVIRDHCARPPSTSRIRLVRPLLSVSRAAIESYCQTHNLSPRLDRSNLDTSFFRNRLRHQLLPELETYNPNIRALLRRTASVAAADYDLLSTVLADAWDKDIIHENAGCISFDLAGWRGLPLALRRATLRRAAFRLRPQLRDVDYVHIKHAVDIATTGSTGAQAILPQGLRLTVGYERLRLTTVDAVPPAPDWPLLWRDKPVHIAMPGRTRLPEDPRPKTDAPALDARSISQWWLEARPWTTDYEAVLSNPDRWTAYLDADRLGTQLMLRRRRPGDRFQPLGMGGQNVQVADYMINAKIPRRWREHIPVLVHDRPGSLEAEEIAWIVGWQIDERVKITPITHRMVRLRWLRS